MNVAFSAMLAFILLIPGLVFLRFRRLGSTHASLVTQVPQPFSVEIALAVLLAICIHAFCYVFVEIAALMVHSPRINLSAALMLLTGHFGKDDQALEESLAAVTGYPGWILAYFLLTFVVAGVAGKISNEFPRSHPIGACLIDQRELLIDEWSSFFQLGKDSDALVTAVVEMGGEAYLFLGILRKLHFNPGTAELDRIELENVAKKMLKDTSGSHEGSNQKWLWQEAEAESSEKYEPVFGNQFILRMSETKTLNVVYLDKKA